MPGVNVQILGIPEVMAALDRIDDAGEKKVLQQAVTAGAKAMKPYVVAAAPRGATGKLKRSISARQARRNRPAAVVSPRPKVAFYRHMVIGGTKEHGPRKAKALVFQSTSRARGWVYALRVKGTPPRPFIARGFAAGEPSAMRAINAVLDKAIGS